MTKKLDPNKLFISNRKEFKKPENDSSMNNIESIVEKIHKPADEKEKTGTKRTTIDLPKPIHKAINLHLLENDLTMKDYFIGLAKKDLGVE